MPKVGTNRDISGNKWEQIRANIQILKIVVHTRCIFVRVIHIRAGFVMLSIALFGHYKNDERTNLTVNLIANCEAYYADAIIRPFYR